jgi:hypothetical protein
MNTCYIEIKIKNTGINPLTLTDLYLCPKSKPDFKILPVDNLQELSKNQAQLLFEQSTENLSPSEYLSLKSEEETSILFEILDPSLFSTEEKYVLNLSCLNVFGAYEKTYEYEFSNTLITYNDYYKITVSEKPDKNVLQNKQYEPSDLVSFNTENIVNKAARPYLRQAAATAFDEMAESFYSEFGEKIYVASAYRTYEDQVRLFDG